MAAGLGFKTFTTGEVLTAGDVNGYLMQGVLVFANAAARTAAITSPQEGQVSFLKDTNSTEYYSGSAWVAVGGSVPTSLEFTAGKNKIINGDFFVNQRNFTSATAEGFGFDRWQNQLGGGTGTVTYSAQTFTPGAAPVSGYEGKTFLRCVTTGQSAAGTYTLIVQKIESVRTLAGQTATLSFWAKAASGTPKIAPEFIQSFGSGGTPSASVTTLATAVEISTSWVRYTIPVTFPSISGKTIGTSADCLELGLWLSAGSTYNSRTNSMGIQSNTFDIWGVQLEAGSTATAFQTATGTFQGELAACQRYYYQSDHTGSAYGRIGIGRADSTTAIEAPIPLPVPMRVKPTSVTISNLTTTTANTITAVALAQPSTTVGSVQFTSSSLTTGQAVVVIGNNNVAAYIAFNAEL